MVSARSESGTWPKGDNETLSTQLRDATAVSLVGNILEGLFTGSLVNPSIDRYAVTAKVMPNVDHWWCWSEVARA